MRGIEFVIDEKGEKRAVLIDLRQHGELWEISTTLILNGSVAMNHGSRWSRLKKIIQE